MAASAMKAQHGENEREARELAILETALDCIIAMDGAGKVTEFNPAAERTFGYRREDAVGRELAELIIPPALREQHRRGLARYLASGEGPVLGRRIELQALHADGSEFPVELAITRVPTPGPPRFIAYLRDISTRVRAEQLRNVRLAVTQHLAQVSSVEEAGARVLRAICENLAWEMGALWVVDSAGDALRCMAIWQPPGPAAEDFAAETASRRFRPGEGLPGRVWVSAQSAWIRNVQQDAGFPRARAASASGLHSAFACPISFGDRLLGVLEFFTTNVRDPDADLLETIGTVAGQVGQFMERRHAEATLRASEARFRALMEQAPFSVQIFSPDGRTIGVNRAWSELWGVTLEQMADYNILEDAQLEAKGVLSHIRRAVAGEAVAIPPIEYNPNETIPGRTLHSDPVRYVAAVAYPIKDEAGRIREIVLVHEDITARRRAENALRGEEAKLRLLADTIPQLAWMAQPDGHIFWYNRRWYEYTGTTPEQMEGWGWQSVHDPAVLPEVLARWKASLAHGEPFDMVFPLRGADGDFRPFLTRVNPLRDAHGRVLYWFGTNTDVSDIKRMEEALREADRRKDDFLAILAHELRNPLAPIRSSLAILKMPEVDAPTAQQLLGVMDRQVEHLVRLVDDLLEVSRVAQGKIELRKEPVELAGIVARAIEIAGPLIEVRRHRLDVSLPPEAIVIDADPVRIVQVVGNLLTNAAKYTQPGGHIRIAARLEGEAALLEVQDNGVGIAPEILPRIFDLFAQGERSAAPMDGGLGVGLTLVKTLVEMHGGSVAAHSAGPGRGATFTLRLPAQILAGAKPADAYMAREMHSARRHKLLVVDDNKDAAETLAALLRLQGHEVRTAHDGPSALETVREWRPAVAFLDIGMPEMDGYELARRMRATPGLERVVLAALTGWGQPEHRRRSAEAGFDHHLLKPPEPAALESLLERIEAG